VKHRLESLYQFIRRGVAELCFAGLLAVLLGVTGELPQGTLVLV